MPSNAPLAALVLSLAVIGVGEAKGQPRTTLRGVAFDSVGMRPLPGALVTLGGARSAFTDSLGAFTFDGVAHGTQSVEMTHARLDSMGLSGIAVRLLVGDGEASVTIAVPSFPTLWRAACGERTAPGDSGFVHGTVRRASDGAAVPGATVELAWTDLSLDGAIRVSQRRYRVEIESDELGEYAICGVPQDAGLRVRAGTDSVASGAIDIGAATLRVLRRDLVVGPTDTTAATPRGTIVGIATDAAGRPFAGASVVLDDGLPQRTGRDGRFAFAGVLPGTRQLEVFAIGVKPQVVIVDVFPGRRTETSVRMERITTLGAVRVTASHWQQRMMNELADRVAKGHGQFRDATTLASRAVLENVFAGLRGVQGVAYAGRSAQINGVWMGISELRRCRATIFIDGYRESDPTRFSALRPQDISVMEVYDRANLVPFPFWTADLRCGAIVIWTKDVMP